MSKRPALVIHVPHASTIIPAEVRDEFVLSDADLDVELRLMTDHLTDETTRTCRPARLCIEPMRLTMPRQFMAMVRW
jgi:hypothetical protein